ncbi:MAG: hypothetical protein P8L85_00495 [Rubripirellula sp.]|nr:hypothetical protein [Rubripirellula sp.]
MMYFIPWCVFLFLVIISVPIASMMETRQRRSAMGPVFETDESVDGEAEEMEVESEFGGLDATAEPADDVVAEFETL